MMKTDKDIIKKSNDCILDTLHYWMDITECVCDVDKPIGGCLKCDMEMCILFLFTTSKDLLQNTKI